MWRSLPPLIRTKIERTVEHAHMRGVPEVYFYKSVHPEAFIYVDTTIATLELLGYQVYYGEVAIEDDPNAVGITTDTKLTIKW